MCAVAVLFCLFAILLSPVQAQDISTYEPVTVEAQDFGRYGRVIITFTDRFDVPAYNVDWDNGVLVITFDVPTNVILPDLSADLPNFVAAARVDPDRKGIRIGLKSKYRVNKTEAGESLYLDILPVDWEGVEPGLPRVVVEELSRRARDAAIIAEQKRRAEYARLNQPTAVARVGRHPTFLRLIIEWDIDVKGEYVFNEQTGLLDFDWPVPVDLYALQADLPPEIKSIENQVDEAGSHIILEAAEGVVPRFYATSSRQYVIDFDSLDPESSDVDLASLLSEGEGELEAEMAKLSGMDGAADGVMELAINVPESTGPVSITPFIDKVGSTIRIVFPFEGETAAAVFRRGDTLWMVFDTTASIGEPAVDDDFAAIAKEFSVVPAGDTSIVRIGLASDRLATLGSEGRSWVLSLGDIVLAPAELVTLRRRQTREGLFEIVADMERPARVHQLRDPEVGDVLEVVTAYPPARGIVRDLAHVDFTALRSIHGLVIQPWHEGVSVVIEEKDAVIKAERGLIVSTLQLARGVGADEGALVQNGFIDLTSLVEKDPRRFMARQEELMQQASEAERRQLDITRYELAKFYLANHLPHESLGVLNVLRDGLTVSDLSEEVEVARAAATVMTGRWKDALDILNLDIMADKPDALIWRTIARNGANDFEGARRDALSAELFVDNYPHWIRERFLLSGIEASIEQGDAALATRLLGLVETAQLDLEMLSEYELLAARIDESAGRFDEALDTFGQVIAVDIRPTRAEAIYRTMLLLDRMDRLDMARAADTLASEVVVWRGNELEAKMLKLLAELYFRNSSFRDAFETVRDLAEAHPDSVSTTEVLEIAKVTFADLYLNGRADALQPIDALTLYYDFRNLTPAGARGDEMVRNLARRLVKVDLLEQASELLQYQIDNRLEGAAKAQIAADLAIIYLANRKPDRALDVLNDTRVAGITPGLERQRRILEARSMVDAGREDLALDIMSRMDGRDADLLRVDAHWRAKRYQEASEVLERLYTPAYTAGNFSQTARLNIVKAAVGFVLAEDRIGITRLRERFSDGMENTPEWPLFNFVTGKVQASSLEFRKVAKEVAGIDSLNAFLATYNATYGSEGALSPMNSAAAADI